VTCLHCWTEIELAIHFYICLTIKLDPVQLMFMSDRGNLSYLSYLSDLNYLSYLSDLSNLSDLSDLISDLNYLSAILVILWYLQLSLQIKPRRLH